MSEKVTKFGIYGFGSLGLMALALMFFSEDPAQRLFYNIIALYCVGVVIYIIVRSAINHSRKSPGTVKTEESKYSLSHLSPGTRRATFLMALVGQVAISIAMVRLFLVKHIYTDPIGLGFFAVAILCTIGIEIAKKKPKDK
ncbi:MAG: hypothetical protein UX13_C0039G0003 [Candidatus Woesebacteria bacterium GW2011_GWB1_45_5]|uniref:Uncharacterized protein n=1 Tax=Candidatus Woesebacteria bacterium GW2011_GWB1_45_5 TaxID=1618581 RepID=A0A0G1PVI1_9BACT|nr:MAG: hypothetical protein UX13_C0039G0003 [Candidatus Woesebacteria bacterium GW2011_GWB1_45_5]